MKNRRGIKYYLRFWLIAMFLYFAFVSYVAFKNDGFTLSIVLSVLYVPFLVTFFMYFFDVIIDWLFPKKEHKEEDDVKKFLAEMTKFVDDECDFTMEDFKRLRDNDGFQKALFHLYLIKIKGETDDINFIKLEKRFKKDTKEYQAVSIVIREVKKLIAN